MALVSVCFSSVWLRLFAAPQSAAVLRCRVVRCRPLVFSDHIFWDDEMRRHHKRMQHAHENNDHARVPLLSVDKSAENDGARGTAAAAGSGRASSGSRADGSAPHQLPAPAAQPRQATATPPAATAARAAARTAEMGQIAAVLGLAVGFLTRWPRLGRALVVAGSTPAFYWYAALVGALAFWLSSTRLTLWCIRELGFGEKGIEHGAPSPALVLFVEGGAA